jgi:hypothetical protein
MALDFFLSYVGVCGRWSREESEGRLEGGGNEFGRDKRYHMRFLLGKNKQTQTRREGYQIRKEGKGEGRSRGQ